MTSLPAVTLLQLGPLSVALMPLCAAAAISPDLSDRAQRWIVAGLGGSSRPSDHVAFRLRRTLTSVCLVAGAEAIMSDATGMTGVAELQELLLATDTLQEFLHEVAYRAAAEVSPGLSCGLTVRSDGRPLTIASSDGYANMLDQLQYRLDQGPCLTSLRTGEVVLDPGVDAGQRWPLYRIEGEAAGLGVSLSVPVSHAGQVLAALNLYSRTPHSFTATERDRARRFADRAAGGVAIALKMARRAELTDDLQAALAGRAIIDQALGIIMGQRRCSADEAFAVLREVSQTGNVKLREVATRLVTVTTGKPPRAEPPLQQGPPTE